jgi:beta-glucanase (GH16 family)
MGSALRLPRPRGRARGLSWLLLLGLAGLIVALVLGALRGTGASPQPLGIRGDWHLVLDSEFDSNQLPAGWKTGWLAGGVTPPANSQEADCYSPGNVTFPGDGTMHLNVTAAPSTCAGVTERFTGAMVTTDPNNGQGPGFQYTYGVLQARVYLPADGSALADWPAVWAVVQPSSPVYGEDDVIEGLNGAACWHFHDRDSESGGCDVAIKPGWHTVASDWQKGSVTFYYDGRKVGSVTSGITSAPMFLLLDNTTNANGAIPDSMRVQYVRVWQ